MLMNLAQSSLPSEGHRLFLQLRSELQAVLCTRSRPTQPLLEPDWRSSSDLTCISSSTRTWDRAAGERDQRSGEIELAEKNRIEPFVLLDLAVLVIRFSSSSFSPLTCCRGTTLCGGVRVAAAPVDFECTCLRGARISAAERACGLR